MMVAQQYDCDDLKMAKVGISCYAYFTTQTSTKQQRLSTHLQNLAAFLLKLQGQRLLLFLVKRLHPLPLQPVHLLVFMQSSLLSILYKDMIRNKKMLSGHIPESTNVKQCNTRDPQQMNTQLNSHNKAEVKRQ